MTDKENNNARLERALHISNTMKTFNLAKRNLDVKIQNRLIYSVNGGSFVINQELIGFVNALKMSGNEACVITDKNNTPVFIENVEMFLDEIIALYNDVMGEYYREYQKLRSSRNVIKMLDIDE